MTAMLTQDMLDALAALNVGGLTSPFAINGLLLLIVLLVFREFCRFMEWPGARAASGVFNLAIVPLFMMFVFILVLRLAALL